MSDFIWVFVKATGERARIPKHYLNNPVLATPFTTKCPSTKPGGREKTGEAGETKEGK